MSVRDSLTNAHPSFTASSPPSPAAGITLAGWVWISVDNNAFSTICRLHSGSGGSTCVVLGFGSDGTTPSVFSAAGSVVGSNCSVGAWYYIGFTLTGTSAVFYQSLGQAALTVTTGTVTPGTAPTGLTFFGRSQGDSSETMNGRLSNWRLWSVVATLAELESEKASATPVKTANLFASWVLPGATDLTDSVNGHNLVANAGALTTEADPPFGTALPDILSGVRIGSLTDAPVIGVALADGLSAARAGSPVEGMARGVVLLEQVGASRAGAPAERIAADVVLADQPGTGRVAGSAESAAIGVAVVDGVSSVRVAGFAETAMTGWVLGDSPGTVRAAGPAEMTSAGVVVLDVISQGRVSSLAESVSLGVTLADTVQAVRVGRLTETILSVLAIPDTVGAVRIAMRPMALVGAASASERDITLTAHPLPSRWGFSPLPSRWTIREANDD